METKEKIDDEALVAASLLEAEFFDIVDGGTPNQHRLLKDGKSLIEFNKSHGQIWKSHEQALIDNGYIQAVPTIYCYEAFKKEIVHPKSNNKIYVDYEILEFNQALTAQEIAELETNMGKKVRVLNG